ESEAGIPVELRVVVRVKIDEAGRDDHPARVEHASRGCRSEPANGRDPAAADADVGAIALRTGAVDNDAVPDHDVEIGHASSLPGRALPRSHAPARSLTYVRGRLPVNRFAAPAEMAARLRHVRRWRQSRDRGMLSKKVGR